MSESTHDYDYLILGAGPGGLQLGYFLQRQGGRDLSLELERRPSFHGSVFASDFARPMLAEGRPKVAGTPILPVCGDTLGLPFPTGTFDGAMVGFGVRNLSDLGASLILP